MSEILRITRSLSDRAKRINLGRVLFVGDETVQVIEELKAKADIKRGAFVAGWLGGVVSSGECVAGGDASRWSMEGFSDAIALCKCGDSKKQCDGAD